MPGHVLTMEYNLVLKIKGGSNEDMEGEGGGMCESRFEQIRCVLLIKANYFCQSYCYQVEVNPATNSC